MQPLYFTYAGVVLIWEFLLTFFSLVKFFFIFFFVYLIACGIRKIFNKGQN